MTQEQEPEEKWNRLEYYREIHKLDMAALERYRIRLLAGMDKIEREYSEEKPASQEVRKALQEQTELRWPTDEEQVRAFFAWFKADKSQTNLLGTWENAIRWLKQQVGNK